MRLFAFRFSFTLILTVTMAVVLIATSAASTVFDVRRENGAFENRVRSRGLSLSAAVTDVFAGAISNGDDEALADAVRDTRIRRELEYLVVIAADGQPIYEELDSNYYSANDGFGSDAIHTETVHQRTMDNLIEFSSPIMQDGKAIAGVQYGFSTKALDGEIAAIIAQRILHTTLLVLVGVVASLLVSRFVTGSVRSMLIAVHKVSAGEEYLPGTKRVSEFALLSDAVGDMVVNLRKGSKASKSKAAREANETEGQAPAAGAAPNPAKASLAKPRAGGADPEEVAPTKSEQFLLDAQQRLEEALKKAREAEDAAQMATRSAHTINNLVTPITAYSQMARKKLPPDSPLISNMQEIEDAGNRIARLATEIQQFVPQAPLIEAVEAAASAAAVELNTPVELTTPVEEEEERVVAPVEDIIENNVVIDQNSTVALVVDDEAVVRRVTTAILKAEGYTVLEAANGVEGVEVARRFSSVPFRLLVTDVLMPIMGAKDLAAILRDIHPETLIVYTSGYTAESLIAHGAMDPNSTFIQKPLTREILLEKIDEALVARTAEINEAAGIKTPVE